MTVIRDCKIWAALPPCGCPLRAMLDGWYVSRVWWDTRVTPRTNKVWWDTRVTPHIGCVVGAHRILHRDWPILSRGTWWINYYLKFIEQTKCKSIEWWDERLIKIEKTAGRNRTKPYYDPARVQIPALLSHQPEVTPQGDPARWAWLAQAFVSEAAKHSPPDLRH